MRRIRIPVLLHSLAMVLMLVATATVPACKHLQPGSLGARVVNCAEKAIRDKGLVYVGRVNDAIANPNLSDREAGLKLGELGTEAGWDIIGCVLLDQGGRFAEAAQANPQDQVSVRAQARANARLAELEDEGWRFERGP